MVLGETLIDEKIVSRTDILRPADFTGDTMKTLVSELLGILDRSGTVSFARMTDYFRQYTINGAEAETVMMAPFDRADNERLKLRGICTSIISIRSGSLPVRRKRRGYWHFIRVRHPKRERFFRRIFRLSLTTKIR